MDRHDDPLAWLRKAVELGYLKPSQIANEAGLPRHFVHNLCKRGSKTHDRIMRAYRSGRGILEDDRVAMRSIRKHLEFDTTAKAVSEAVKQAQDAGLIQ